MPLNADFYEHAQRAIGRGVELGVGYLNADDEVLDGIHVTVDGTRLVSFGSCSYLGLEMDERVKGGAIAAARRYGTQFSCSRAFISSPGYRVLEDALAAIFQQRVILAATTRLAHQSFLPLAVQPGDAVLRDRRVHESVRASADMLIARGVHIESVAHNDMEALEERVVALQRQHPAVWYLCDSIYSMHGDVCPLDVLDALCKKYEQLRVYVDDAHGMSMTGARGQGFALEHVRPSKQIHCVTSFAKAFGGSGAALLVGDEALAKRISLFAGPILFSGPLHPPMIGANIESAKIHLGSDMPVYQQMLAQRLAFLDAALEKQGIYVECRSVAPFRYVRVPGERGSYDMAAYLREQGYLVPPVVFPIVPAEDCGIRISITRLHSESDIAGLTRAVAAGMAASQ